MAEKSDHSITYQLKAVIDIGSTSIRMVVAQVFGNGTFQTLDTLNQSVSIGSDTFTRGRISRSTIGDAVKVLRNFSSVLNEYNIDPKKDVYAVATSAVREARNRDEFIDRVSMATDIEVQAIDGTEVNRLTFLAIQPTLKKYSGLRKNRLLVAEVGGGSTELLGLDQGRVSFAHIYRMGAYRLREAMDGQEGSVARKRDVLQMEIDSGIRQCRDAVPRDGQPLSLLLMGGEARFTAQTVDADWDEQSVIDIRLNELEKLAEKILSMDVEKVVRKYHMTIEEAQTLAPALLTYVKLAQAFGVKKVSVCGASLRDGLLTEAASGGAWSEDFVEQVLHSVHEVGRRYQLDQNHADCVTEISRAIFRALKREHKLSFRYEVILTVAAQLHDVGMFIGSSSHHKHSQYIIENSDLFGLGEEDIKLVALVARYHRRANPRPGHPGYGTLTRENRLAVNKLAAILRAADAFDRSHTQAIRDVKISVHEEEVVVETTRSGDFTAEKRALAGKAKLFEQVYGRTMVLRSRRRRG
ncbi:Ppx/GppA phosphatase family protein [Pontiella agarivorans]|uniref:Ppx/GppA phosphatase family protein n=1 Tax=Pontiella agarivorans TaxID=3038953 RepID=A0ABU5N2A7_9BACT|nr:Ppx/GppA phosphatase family protein [Pontiella agarivorans]MDZ8120386.1 Ppx/GppA phosphatase family protein [Pontiella agarivorans]